jgi:hypothetical protein
LGINATNDPPKGSKDRVFEIFFFVIFSFWVSGLFIFQVQGMDPLARGFKGEGFPLVLFPNKGLLAFFKINR